MSKINIYNQKGEKVGTTNLNPIIFNLQEKPDLMHQAVVYQIASARHAVADTKKRADVRGGGRKPWRQKGTGRARASSTRSPIWRGGGVVFGPTKDRNFKKALSKKMRRLALYSALSNKVNTDKMILLDRLEFTKIKTKQVEQLLSKLPIKEGTILLVISKLDPKVEHSCRNLPYLKTILVNDLNILDLLKYDWLVLTREALEKIEGIYSAKTNKSGAKE